MELRRTSSGEVRISDEEPRKSARDSGFDSGPYQTNKEERWIENWEAEEPIGEDNQYVGKRPASRIHTRLAHEAVNNHILQKVVLTLHSASFIISFVILLVLCCFPALWPFLGLYVLYISWSNAGRSGILTWRSDYLRSLSVWNVFASYFPVSLHRTVELQPTRKYILGYHPHGIICHGAFIAFATEALGFSKLFPGVTNTLLTLDSNFSIPVYREYALSMGLGGVSRQSCERLLSRDHLGGNGIGRSITIVIGGARESLLAKPKTMRIIIKDRKGFIKLAIAQGADLVPVIGFGENELYDHVDAKSHPRITRFQMRMKKHLGWTLPAFYGTSFFGKGIGFLPYQRPVNVVVGRPVRVENREIPDDQYVDEIHKAYMEEIKCVWEAEKDKYARKGTELELL